MIEDVIPPSPLPFVKPKRGDVWAEDINLATSRAVDLLADYLSITADEWDAIYDVVRDKLNQAFSSPDYRSYN